jgi:hypothetical protein
MANNINPSLLNEFTVSYTTDHIFLTPSGTSQRPAGMSMTGLFDDGFGGKLPGMSINNGTPYGGGFTADVAGWPWNNANPTYTYRDQIAKIWGSHNIYAGFYMAVQQKNEQNGAETQGFLNFSNSSPVTTGNAWADFLPAASPTSARRMLRPSITTAPRHSSRISRTTGTSPAGSR